MAPGVAEFYRDKTIFLTGATGFLGSCLVEKLLRCCSVERIYVLLRPKKEQSIEERLEALKKDSVFNFFRAFWVLCFAGFAGFARVVGSIVAGGGGWLPPPLGFEGLQSW